MLHLNKKAIKLIFRRLNNGKNTASYKEVLAEINQMKVSLHDVILGRKA